MCDDATAVYNLMQAYVQLRESDVLPGDRIDADVFRIGAYRRLSTYPWGSRRGAASQAARPPEGCPVGMWAAGAFRPSLLVAYGLTDSYAGSLKGVI